MYVLYLCRFSAKPSALDLAMPNLLKEVSNRCHLPSTLCSALGLCTYIYIPLKTTATTALPLACMTLKRFKSCLRHLFLLTTTFMCSCSRLGAPKARLYATHHSLHIGQVHLPVIISANLFFYKSRWTLKSLKC